MNGKNVGVMLMVATCAFPAAARADLNFCNHTAAPVTVAVAYVEKDAPGTTTNGHRGVTVEGWWRFEPNECASVTDIDHAGGYWVYYYAHSTSGLWEGTARLCVAPRRFKTGTRFLMQGDGCPAGSRAQGFRRAETNARNHTINLR